ncbi:uncharacterized protein AB9X84_005275 [Acanthopagrus schlegelii]
MGLRLGTQVWAGGVSVCDRLRRGPDGVGRLRRPRPPEAGSSQSGVNVRGEQEKGCLTDGGLTWKTCPLFRVQQSADDSVLAGAAPVQIVTPISASKNLPWRSVHGGIRDLVGKSQKKKKEKKKELKLGPSWWICFSELPARLLTTSSRVAAQEMKRRQESDKHERSCVETCGVISEEGRRAEPIRCAGNTEDEAPADAHVSVSSSSSSFFVCWQLPLRLLARHRRQLSVKPSAETCRTRPRSRQLRDIEATVTPERRDDDGCLFVFCSQAAALGPADDRNRSDR